MEPEMKRSPRLPGRWFPILLDALYLGGSVVAAPVVAAKGRWKRSMESVRRRTGPQEVPPATGPRVWLHAVSVGEMMSARSFVSRFGEVFPRWEMVVSSSTRTGVDSARRSFPGKPVISFPLDLSRLVRRAFEAAKPDLVVIVEHDFWPNFFWWAARLDVPIAVINARISERSFRGYRRLPRALRWLLPAAAAICAQDEASATRLAELGVPADRLRMTGNLKFDNIPTRVAGMREKLGIAPDEWVLVGASTHEGEEAMLLDAFEGLRHEGSARPPRLILVPRRPERAAEVLGLLEARGLASVRWSGLVAGSGSGTGSEAPVILVDTVGDLDGISSAADAVFVGGSLVPFGGHNVMAPGGMGLPVVTGPHHHSFAADVAAFVARDAIVIAKDPADLTRAALALRADPARAADLGRRARELVDELRGATDRTLEALRPILEAVEARRREPRRGAGAAPGGACPGPLE